MFSGATEIPAYLIAILMYAKFGRKSSALVFFLICGIAVTLTSFIPKGKHNMGVDV